METLKDQLPPEDYKEMQEKSKGTVYGVDIHSMGRDDLLFTIGLINTQHDSRIDSLERSASFFKDCAKARKRIRG